MYSYSLRELEDLRLKLIICEDKEQFLENGLKA